MKKLLVVDSYDSFTHNLIQLIDQHTGFDYTLVKTDQVELEGVRRYDKILLTPGPGLPRESEKLLQLLHFYAPTKSILGVCLGLQAIGEAFGATLFQLPQVLHGLTQTMQVTSEGQAHILFQGLPSALSIGLYHSWVIQPSSLPDTLQTTGVLPRIDSPLLHFGQVSLPDFPLIMALKHRQFDVHGIQFHPESIMTQYGREILYNWLNN